MEGKLHGTRLFVAIALVLCIVAAGPASAQYESWAYSRNVDVRSGDVARTEAPVELMVNFTTWLATAGGAGKTLDLNSIRVVEYSDAGRTVLVGEKPSQFDQAAGFHAQTNARGELVWILNGNTPINTTRYFKVFFDATENGLKAAPNYSTGLSWNPGTRQVDTPGYRVTYSATKEGFPLFENKLSGSPVTMWTSNETEWWDHGHAHVMYLAPWFRGWQDSFGGPGEAVHSVVAGPVRITVKTERDAGLLFWTSVRKFYAGQSSTPYFKASVKADMSPGQSVGQGWNLLKRVVWSVQGATTPRTLVPPTNFDPETNHPIVFDYGPDGGVGVLASGQFRPNSTESYPADQNNILRMAQFETWGETWKMEKHPVGMDYAFVVHNQTTEASANTAVTSAWQQFNSPLQVIPQNENILTGVITDASTALPVRNAIVRARSGSFFSKTTRTSDTGHYIIDGAPTGSVTFSVKGDGYAYHAAMPSLAAGLNTVNVQLNKAQSINMRNVDQGGDVTWLLGTDTLAGGPVVPPNDNFSAPGASEAGFLPTAVPGNWDIQQGPSQHVYGWYRTTFTVPSGWSGQTLRLRNFRVEDVDATYINGTLIGKTGEFPDPAQFRSETGATLRTFWPRDYYIPAGNVNFGGSNTIAIRAYDSSGFLQVQSGGITYSQGVLEVALPTATVVGKVSGPGGAIAGATVELVGFGTTTTNATGDYSFQYVMGAHYTLNISAYGFKDYTDILDVQDFGTTTKNVTLESAGSISGQVLRGGAPFYRCRVYYTGPTNGTMLTSENGNYSFTALPGTYTIVFNGFNAVPATHQVNVAGPEVLNVDLPYGVTPIYDGFPGTTLDMTKWQFFNGQIMVGTSGDATATVSNGTLRLDIAPHRGGVISTASFPPISTHEVMFPAAYQGVNQLMNLYAGAGGMTNFVELGQEGYFLGAPRTQVWGTTGNAGSASWMGFPFAMGVVRTHNYYDFYIDGQYWHTDTSSGLVSQNARVYLYGYEPPGGDSVAFFSAIAAGTPVQPTAKSVGQSRNSPTGEAVSISGAIVTAKYGQYYHIQAPDRSSALKVMAWQGLPFDNPPNPNPNVGDVVDVIGRVVHVNNEAILQRISQKVVGTAALPEPLMITHTPTGTFDGEGARIQAMRVQVVGKITAVELNDQAVVTGFFIDDGSNISLWPNTKGIYIPVPVAWINEGWQPPWGPDFFPEWATVTGVVTQRSGFGFRVPMIQPNSKDDVEIEIIF